MKSYKDYADEKNKYYSLLLQIALFGFHFFVSIYWILKILARYFSINLYYKIFLDNYDNIRFGIHWGLAIQYSKRLLFIPMAIIIIVISILNYKNLLQRKKKNKKVLLSLLIVTITITIISTASCCYGYWCWWSSESA